MAQKQSKGRKIGRQKKKNLRKGSPISQYVRKLIAFDQYQKLEGQKTNKW
jgi:hypothetical protein